MKCEGIIKDAIRTIDGKIMFMCEVEEIPSDEVFDKFLHEPKLEISIEKWRNKRSINANAYFWQLCDKMAKKTGFDRWTMYLIQLRKYGKFFDVSVINRAIPMLKKTYRYTEVIEEGEMNNEPASVVRCFVGSSQYDTEEMSDLINGTVEDAKEWGIETMTPNEIRRMLAAWKGEFNEQQQT